MIGLTSRKYEKKILSVIIILSILVASSLYATTAQAGTVASDFLGLNGVTGYVVDSVFDSGCKVIGGTTYNMAQTLYETGTGVVKLLTGEHSTAGKIAGWTEVGLNLASVGGIIAAIVTGSATLPVIAAITFGVAAGKLVVAAIKNGENLFKNGDKILTWLEKFIGNPLKSLLDVYKPNIYLYSDTDMEVNVRLHPSRCITESIPPYDPDTGWNAEIYNGSLDGCNNYLFYEARVPDRYLQRESGFQVKQSGLRDDMLRIMTLYGFNKKETDDFIQYWESKLAGEEDYVFYPQETSTVEKIMPLSVDPAPPVVFRLWFLIEIDRGQDYDLILQAKSIPRGGYTVVEWGGMMGSN